MVKSAAVNLTKCQLVFVIHIRLLVEQHLCQELYNGWTESDQLRFIKQILYKLNPSQRVQMLDFQIQLDLRDFISLLASKSDIFI